MEMFTARFLISIMPFEPSIETESRIVALTYKSAQQLNMQAVCEI